MAGVEGMRTKGEVNVGAGGMGSKRVADYVEAAGSRETVIVTAAGTMKKAEGLERTQMAPGGQVAALKSWMKVRAQEPPPHTRPGPGLQKEEAGSPMVQAGRSS